MTPLKRQRKSFTLTSVPQSTLPCDCWCMTTGWICKYGPERFFSSWVDVSSQKRSTYDSSVTFVLVWASMFMNGSFSTATYVPVAKTWKSSSLLLLKNSSASLRWGLNVVFYFSICVSHSGAVTALLSCRVRVCLPCCHLRLHDNGHAIPPHIQSLFTFLTNERTDISDTAGSQ